MSNRREPMSLYEIATRYDELADNYKDDTIIGSGDRKEKSVLSNYNDDFAFLYKEIRTHAKSVYGHRTARDDKASSAYKARIARGLCTTGHPDLDSGKPMTWNKAYEFAGSTDEYETFLAERIEAYEDWDSMQQLRDSIKQYMINIGGRLSQYT